MQLSLKIELNTNPQGDYGNLICLQNSAMHIFLKTRINCEFSENAKLRLIRKKPINDNHN